MIMENFNHGSFRNNLAKELKDARQKDPEKVEEILEEAKETEDYKNSESKYRKLAELEKIAKEKFDKYKDIIGEVNNEIPYFTSPYEDRGLEKIESFTNKRVERKLYKYDFFTNIESNFFKGKYNGRDYAKEYGSDYFGEFSKFQENLYVNRLINEQLGLFEGNSKTKTLERIENGINNDTFIPHDIFRCIELLSVSGISGEQLEKLKAVSIKSGNFNILRKIMEEFPIVFSIKELGTALKNAVDKNSLFDITNLIKMAGEDNVDPVFIEKKELLFRNINERFVENRKTIEDGVKNKDFLLHFTGTPYLDSILQNGILSNLDQIGRFGESNFGQGNDLQRVTGRLDTISILDVFKGANGEQRDSKLFEEMRLKIQNLIDEFLITNYKYNPACIFELTNPQYSNERVYRLDKSDDNALNELKKKYSHPIQVFKTNERHIDPNEKNIDGGYNSLLILHHDDHNEIKISYVNKPKHKEFLENFFKEWTDDKQVLIDSIKKLMRDTYIESNREENNKKNNVKDFERQCDLWIREGKNPTLLLDPSMERTFVQSWYSGESLVEGSISPDKILGFFANNAHLERVAYNEGKVIFDFKDKEELSKEQKEDILFETPNGAIVIKNLYE